MEQYTIFDMIYEPYKINKPIRLIELFAGIGSQSKALENLKVDFEHWKICEWAIPSILAYKEIHQDYLPNYKVDFAKDKTKEELIDYLFNLGISSNYNEPMKIEQIKRQSETKLKKIYNAIKSENNLVNISTTNGEDLEIIDTDKYDYIVTYSFPCQDLSLAGKLKGMSRDGSTRSGLLWQVERLLKECKELPQVLLMENVPQVIGEKNIKDFQEWQRFLEKLGYKNYIEILNAKDYEIPQNRRRCFMVSILGNYVYNFPQKQKLKLRLKNMLEDEVDEKYYLSGELLKTGIYSKIENLKNIVQEIDRLGDFTNENIEKYNRATEKIEELESCLFQVGNLSGGKWDKIHEYCRRVYSPEGLALTIPTVCGGNHEPKIIDKPICLNSKGGRKGIEGLQPSLQDRVYDVEGISTAITTSYMPSIVIPEATKKGYAEAHDGDGVYINRPHQKRGVVQKGMIQTLKTSPDVGVVVESAKEKKYSDYSLKKIKGNIIKGDIVGTITANAMQSVTHDNCHLYNNGLQIRKLTPKECYRLMGFNDLDCERASKVISDSMIYHTAGDSIVVNVLMAIFKMFF